MLYDINVLQMFWSVSLMVWFLIETSEIVDNDNNADQSFHVNDALHISHKFSASQIQDSQILNKLLYYKLIKIFAIQKAEQVRGIYIYIYTKEVNYQPQAVLHMDILGMKLSECGQFKLARRWATIKMKYQFSAAGKLENRASVVKRPRSTLWFEPSANWNM